MKVTDKLSVKSSVTPGLGALCTHESLMLLVPRVYGLASNATNVRTSSFSHMFVRMLCMVSQQQKLKNVSVAQGVLAQSREIQRGVTAITG